MILLREGKKSHYALIKDLSAIMWKQSSYKYNKKYFCNIFLSFFLSQERLDLHLANCLKFNDAVPHFPEKKYIEFEDIYKNQRHPFCVYADCESILEAVNSEGVKGSFNKHKLCAIGYYFHSDHPDLIESKYVSYRGKNAGEWFALEMQKLALKINYILLNTNIPIFFTEQQYIDFKNAVTCELCKGSFSEHNPKNADHLHLDGTFRFCLCRQCNTKLKKQYLLPTIFHNYSFYDAHLIINDMSKIINGKMQVLAKNSETYLNIKMKVPKTKVWLNFIDSYRFLSSSLDTLANYLPDDEKDILRHQCTSEEEFNFLKNKSFIPYEYIQNEEILKQREKPSQDKFFSRLKNCGISDENYLHFSRMWDFFKCENLGQLLEIYLKADVLILSCVFENFRREAMKTYNLEPVYFISLSSFA